MSEAFPLWAIAVIAGAIALAIAVAYNEGGK